MALISGGDVFYGFVGTGGLTSALYIGVAERLPLLNTHLTPLESVVWYGVITFTTLLALVCMRRRELGYRI